MVAQRKERVFLMVCGWVVLAIDFAQADMEIPCVDYLADGYYQDKIFTYDTPPSGFLLKPATLSLCELESLHSDCVRILNEFRSGQRGASDGSVDADVESGNLPPLQEAIGENRCTNGAALGTFMTASDASFCSVSGFPNFGVCKEYGTLQACRAFGVVPTYSGLLSHVEDFLQNSRDSPSSWAIMKNANYGYASCGFSFTDSSFFLLVNFQSATLYSPACEPSCQSCSDSDGCGKDCVCGIPPSDANESGNCSVLVRLHWFALGMGLGMSLATLEFEFQ